MVHSPIFPYSCLHPSTDSPMMMMSGLFTPSTEDNPTTVILFSPYLFLFWTTDWLTRDSLFTVVLEINDSVSPYTVSHWRPHWIKLWTHGFPLLRTSLDAPPSILLQGFGTSPLREPTIFLLLLPSYRPSITLSPTVPPVLSLYPSTPNLVLSGHSVVFLKF